MEFLIDHLLDLYGPTPYVAILGILLACGFGLPIPEDVTLFAAGVLAYYGVSNLYGMIAIAMAGVLIGDSCMYFLGLKYGRVLTRRWLFHKILTDERLASVGNQFRTRGNKLLFFARFMPGLRAPIYFSAGTLHVPFRTFLFYDGFAALISVPAIIGAVYYFGDELEQTVRWIKRLENGLVISIFVGIGLLALKWYRGHRKSRATSES